jgi:hypothetical protein
MKRKTPTAIALVLLVLVLAAPVAFAERTATPTQEADPEGEAPRFGVEVSLLYPFVAQALQIKTSWQLRGGPRWRGEALLGLLAVPLRRDVEAKAFTEVDVIVGYRQLLWRGLHVEASFPVGWARQDSAIDQVLRHALVLNADLLVGYRFDMELGSATASLNIQGGVGIIAYVSDPWPEANRLRYGEPFPSGNASLGLRW